MNLEIFKLNDTVNIPKYATSGSACFDLEANLLPGASILAYQYQHPEPSNISVSSDGTLDILPFERVLVPTNLIFNIPEGYQLKIHPRSGLSLKQGLVIANMTGIIDSDYVEPLFVMLWNIRGMKQRISNGNRIAQAELQVAITANILETTEKPQQKTNRIGGYGSTGV